MANNRFALQLFSILPDTMLFVEIAKYLSPSELANLVMSCWANLERAKNLDQYGYYDQSLENDYKNDFKKIINYKENQNLYFNSRIHAMQKYLKQAGMCILQGKMKEALAMIDRDSGLLLQVLPSITLKKNNLTHEETHVGRTLYQLALGTYDHELYQEIGKRIEKEFEFGHAVKAQQFNEQFPKDVKKKSYRAAFDSLLETMAADETINFVDGKNIMNETTRNALEALEMSLVAELKKCTTGVHFDLQIVIDFIDAYEAGKSKFTNENKKWDQLALYWRCGFGKLEKFMPYFVAMAINEQNKFFEVMDGKAAVTRSTLLRNGSDFFEITLGDSHWAICGGAGRGCAGVAHAVGIHVLARLESFVKRAQKYLDDLSSNCSNQQTLTCTK